MEIQSFKFPVCFILCKICTVCGINDARIVSKRKLSLADGTLRAGCGCLATFAGLYHRYVEIFPLQTTCNTFCIRILIKRKSIDQGNTVFPFPVPFVLDLSRNLCNLAPYSHFHGFADIIFPTAGRSTTVLQSNFSMFSLTFLLPCSNPPLLQLCFQF